ncbi:unnamed protein product [Rhodiola kirilowii]
MDDQSPKKIERCIRSIVYEVPTVGEYPSTAQLLELL